ncbi:MAG: vWA domain-containing protein [Cyanobacteria bacterium P01_A01_bin.84]
MSNILNNRLQEVAREDLVMFINACLACTGQKEFYDDAYGQKVSIDFLHEYILGNYRLLYARSLAAGINHFNQAQIIVKLLATGKNTPPEHKEEEGALIAKTLNKLPSQRAWGVLQQLRNQKINNRRSRAIIRDYIKQRQDISFDALKYRSKVRSVVSHAHLKFSGELGNFLFHNWKQKEYKTELFENYRQAHFSTEAVYKLPFTVAEGLAAKHKIPRHLFLSRIQEHMTLGEKLRFQGTAERNKIEINLDYSRLPLTKLALYILSLPLKTRRNEWHKLNQALEKSAHFILRKFPLKLGKVAAVLDCSYSSFGSFEKRRRPLGIALATHYLLKAASTQYSPFWTMEVQDELLVNPRGQTDLATPLLDALEWNPELVIIVSDGFDNDPPTGASEVLRIFRTRIDPKYQTSIIHCNPVFNSNNFSLRKLSQNTSTVGLRNAEDLPTMLNFARFAEGSAPLSELEDYLEGRVRQMLETL